MKAKHSILAAALVLAVCLSIGAVSVFAEPNRLTIGPNEPLKILIRVQEGYAMPEHVTLTIGYANYAICTNGDRNLRASPLTLPPAFSPSPQP